MEQVQKYNGQTIDPKIIESLVLQGDISKMDSKQRVDYYKNFCESLGLNPLTQPFQIIKFQGKETLYAKKDATEQLRKIYGVSVVDMTESTVNEVYIVKCKVQDKNGRYDMATGAVNIKGLSGENLANAIMKAETKSKRRATLSICGLGMLDESEVDSIGHYETVPLKVEDKPKQEVKPASKPERRNYTEETKDFNSLKQLSTYYESLTDKEKTEAEGVLKERKDEILQKKKEASDKYVKNIEAKIAEINITTTELELNAIDSLLDKMSKQAREPLAQAFNQKCNMFELNHEYSNPL